MHNLCNKLNLIASFGLTINEVIDGWTLLPIMFCKKLKLGGVYPKEFRGVEL